MSLIEATKNSKIIESLDTKSKVSSIQQNPLPQNSSSQINDQFYQNAFQNPPQLQNIVATVNLNCPLNLKQIALQARNAEYNPWRFAAVIMRLKVPKTTALIFASGKMVCTGSKTEEFAKIASRKFARIIQKLGNPVQFTQFKIQNIVASCDIGHTLDLEYVSNKYSEFCSYEPEVFPGLVFRILDPKLVVLIFVSGKIVFTGAKNKKDIDSSFQKILPMLEEGRKKKLEFF